jgi:hypothetical protein
MGRKFKKLYSQSDLPELKDPAGKREQAAHSQQIKLPQQNLRDQIEHVISRKYMASTHIAD